VETPVPVDTRNCAEIGQTNILAGTDLYRPDLDRDSDGVGCETGVTGEPVADAAPQQNIVGQVPVTSTTAVSVPLSNSGDVQAPPTQLAYTGAQEDLNWTLGILGASALVGGSILIGLKRKLA
jgi:LPXTG-motif cell wall-anchored protein